MTTAGILTAFQTINANVTGITSAFDADEMPLTLAPEHLPAAVTLPGAATWHPGVSMGKGRKCQRAYHVRLLVASVESDPSVAFVTVTSVLDAVGQAYRAVASVGGALITAREDQGSLRTYAFGGQQYYGTEFRITVEEPA